MTKLFGKQVTECPNCGAGIGEAHPYRWCAECGEPLADTVLLQIPQQASVLAHPPTSASTPASVDGTSVSSSSSAVKVITWIAVIVFAAIAGSIGRRAVQSGAEVVFSDDSRVTENMLQQMAKELNSGLPMMIDKETRLDRVSAGPGKKVTHHYTLVTISSSDVTAQQLRDAMEEKTENEVCDMRDFRDNGVVVSYSYRGKDGGVIGDIAVYPRDCL